MLSFGGLWNPRRPNIGWIASLMCLASPLHWPRRNHFGPMSEIHGFTADLTLAVGPKNDFWSHWNPVMGPFGLDLVPARLTTRHTKHLSKEPLLWYWTRPYVSKHIPVGAKPCQLYPQSCKICCLQPRSCCLNSNVCWLNKWKLVEKKTVCQWNHHLGLSKSQNKVSQVLKWGHPPFPHFWAVLIQISCYRKSCLNPHFFRIPTGTPWYPPYLDKSIHYRHLTSKWCVDTVPICRLGFTSQK